MPPTERSKFSLQEMVIWLVLPFVVGAAVGYALASYSFTGPGSDRPPIIVSDGSIKVEEVESGDDYTPNSAKGEFKSQGTSGNRATWKHEHPDNAPKRLHVLVEGSDPTVSNGCPAVYFVQNITTATLAYRYTEGDRTVIVSRDNKDEVVFDVDKDASVTQTGGTHTLLIDEGAGADLVSVTFTRGSGKSGPITCQLGPTPRLTFLQTTK